MQLLRFLYLPIVCKLSIYPISVFIHNPDHSLLFPSRPMSMYLQHLIHKALEELSGILEPKGHPQKLLQPKGGDDRCLGDVLLGHRDLVVPLAKIQHAEDLLAGQPS